MTRGAWALALALAVAAATRAPGANPVDGEWVGAPEQKIWGLMQVWGTVRHNFAFFERLPDLDWDAAVRAAIPRVLEAEDREEYYRRLGELTALLHDGHTLVVSPSLYDDAYDNPPVEFQMVEGRIVLARAGDTEEIRSQRVRPGMVLVTVGDDIPAGRWLQENALRYYPGSTRHGGEAFGMFLFLRGPKGTAVKLGLADANGVIRTVVLTRNGRNLDGTVFRPRIRDVSPLAEAGTPAPGIACIRVASFDDEGVVGEVNAALDRLDLKALRGLILDLRYNIGGDDRFAYPLVSRFVDHPVLGSTWRTPAYHPAYASWGKPEEPLRGDPVRFAPAPGKRYGGPLVILTGPNTMSTSEDFIVPLDHSGRALIVGEPTAGTTGNPVNVRLPGGAVLRVCSLWSTYPDGREFVGKGIQPDVAAHPTLAGIRAGRDEVLEKAVEVLIDWSAYRALKPTR